MDKIEKIEKLGVNLDEDKIQNLKEVFRSYKKGDVSGDDLVHDLASSLEVDDESGLRVLERVFPELRELKPLASSSTLRSHMTSGWFLTLQSLHQKKIMPIKLFSIDRCFRREQKEDSSHLMTYHSASCVWMDDEMSMDVGMAVSENLLHHLALKSSNSCQMRRNPNITSPPPKLRYMVIIPNWKIGWRWLPSVFIHHWRFPNME